MWSAWIFCPISRNFLFKYLSIKSNEKPFSGFLSCLQTNKQRSHCNRRSAGTQTRLYHKNVHHHYNCKLENCFLMPCRPVLWKSLFESQRFFPEFTQKLVMRKARYRVWKNYMPIQRADAWNLRLAKPRLDRDSYTSAGPRDSQMSVGLEVGWNKHHMSWNWLL